MAAAAEQEEEEECSLQDEKTHSAESERPIEDNAPTPGGEVLQLPHQPALQQHNSFTSHGHPDQHAQDVRPGTTGPAPQAEA